MRSANTTIRSVCFGPYATFVPPKQDSGSGDTGTALTPRIACQVLRTIRENCSMGCKIIGVSAVYVLCNSNWYNPLRTRMNIRLFLTHAAAYVS